MDEFQRWQLERIGRELWDYVQWLETSGALAEIERAQRETAASGIPAQLQAAQDALANRIDSGVVAEFNRIAAIVRDIHAGPSGAAHEVLHTYAELINSLSAFHWIYAGVGVTFTVRAGAGRAEDAPTQARQFELPAAESAEAAEFPLLIANEATDELHRVSFAPNQDESGMPGLGQVVEIKTLAEILSESSANAFTEAQSWTIERSENPGGEHRFILQLSGDRSGPLLDWLSMVLQSAMRGDMPALDLSIQQFRQVVEAQHAADSQDAGAGYGARWMNDICPDGAAGGLAEEEAAPEKSELSYVEKKIKAAYDAVVARGDLHPTDETIAARLPLGRKGQPYSRETVNRYRNKMRKRGIDV